MHANRRAGRFTARLGLESLEGRTLLSATAIAPQAAPVTQAQPLSTMQTSVAHYSYSLGVGPSAVLTGTNSSTFNGRSTGSVAVALYRAGTASARVNGPAVALPIGVVISTSSASTATPDHFNKPLTITLKIRDAATGASHTFTFKGTIKGTLSTHSSALTLTFQGPLTQTLKLGTHHYTITLKTGSLHVPAPGTRPALISATVRVT
jgi:hypothetical protein